MMNLRVPRWLEAVLSLDGTLDKKEQQKRTLFLALNVVSFVFIVVFLASVSSTVGDRPLEMIGSVLFMCTTCMSIVVVLTKTTLSVPFVVTVASLYGVAILCFDFSKRAFGSGTAHTLVLVVDLLLVMQTPARYTAAVVCCTIAWLLLMGIEEYVRFGLLDMPGLPSQGGADGRRAYFDSFTGCTDLPCARDSSHELLVALAVFVLDFVATRKFAHDILKEQASMERTISAVQEIASLLAGYDVEMVAELLAVHEAELPEGIRDALRKLEENLRVYKAYLPQTCLPYERRKTTYQLLASPRKAVFPRVPSTDELTTMSCSSVASSLLPTMATLTSLPLDLSSVSATLLTLNIKDTLHRLEEDSARFSDLFTTLLLKTLQATEVRRGMVDVFVGDRIHCSFNTSKQCASHATSALHAATLLLCGDDNNIAPHVNMGVATGKVLRGDMGCEVMRRFSMVGTLVRDVNVLERAGRVLGCSVLCNRLCFKESECEHQLRLVPCKVEVGESREEVVAELVVPEEAATPAQAEWMYMLKGDKQWEDYNTAVRGYLRGELSASAVAAVLRDKNSEVDNVIDIPAQCEVLQVSVHVKKLASSTLMVCDPQHLP